MQRNPAREAQTTYFTSDGLHLFQFDFDGIYDDGNWHHFAVTDDSADAGEIVSYVDSEEVASSDVTDSRATERSTM